MADEVRRVSVDIGGTEITFETGKLAKQAGGAVVVSAGDTMVLATATAGNIRDVDFLPLTVDVEERMYAAGKIPGSFFKREGRAGEKATLIARMIDRPLRPLFPKGWRYETQLVSIPLSIDHDAPWDILAMNGASAALMVSNIPFPTPVGAVRIGKVEGNFVVNPTEEQQLTADLDLVVAGTDEAILMVEAGANEITEAEMLDALDIAHDAIRKLCAAQHELAAKAPKEKLEVTAPQVDQDLYAQIEQTHGAKLDEATSVQDKLARQDATKAVEAEVLEHYSGDPAAETYAEYRSRAQLAFDKLEKNMIRQRIAVHKKRPDGRSEAEIRPIATEVGLLPRTHGSALFTRGQTQALSVVALGTTREEMRLDNLGLETSKRYFHHYNFPPFSVGEAGFMRGPKRRDIGHGALAERALVPMIPDQEKFPYTIRVVSDILESNGSSSMASVCGGALSLMDAGVPLVRPVAGIAMGLIKEGERFAVLSDILGDEDHLGDMDFKVAGTERGITSLQMDLKITSINEEIMKVALGQAKDGRIHILGEMAKGLGGAREQVSQNAPRITQFTIPKDKIREVIGTGGKVIREITETTGTKIDIEDDGTIKVAAVDAKAGQAAIDWIKGIVAEPEVGVVYNGKVVKVVEFGAFVNFLGSRDGLVHISELAPRRVAKVTDVVKEGDQVKVKVLGIDDRGKVRLSMKVVDQETGEDIPQKPREP